MYIKAAKLDSKKKNPSRIKMYPLNAQKCFVFFFAYNIKDNQELKARLMASVAKGVRTTTIQRESLREGGYSRLTCCCCTVS